MKRFFCALALLFVAISVTAQTAETRPELIYHPKGNFVGETDRPLRYLPIAGDFVITNGTEFFNRPLYCMNSPFRVDAGDKPEFSLYLPGRGGNLRLGFKTEKGAKWLNDADEIVTKYRPGSMLYQIHDRLLGESFIELDVMPLSDSKGFIARMYISKPTEGEFIWAFGGANGMRGSRGGDIGCEREPVSQFFQLRPEQCRSNQISAANNTFVLRSRTATISGTATPGATHAVADARQWGDLNKLLASTNEVVDLPVVVGRIPLAHKRYTCLVLKPNDEAVDAGDGAGLVNLFLKAETNRSMIAHRVSVETPDAFIDAAAGALNVAVDGVWDEPQQAFMHGAVAWRQRLLGWRGPYSGDALGWHERTAAHFTGYAKNQNVEPIPEKMPPADEEFNLARSEKALHSNGDLMNRSHYDMNLVAVDAFFRHLLWTGDTNYAAEMWPVIERHLAWERRLFRREFGEDKLPLYEAYAAIWASDDLNYNGGGTTHGSAYNYWHYKMAAKVAKVLGKDGSMYEREADLIAQGMRKYLWLAKDGMFGEFKDYLGLQLVHPNAGLWSFYHTMDSEVPTGDEAMRMAQWVDEKIAHIPVGVSAFPEEKLYVLPETSWMPYQWSLNNVVVGELMHTSLGFWQANRRDAAFPLFKGALMDTMFTGLCPGNVGAMTSHDMARGEAQRDFADGIGMTSRALVEGLFGVKPDALAGELRIVPGFPAEWDHASMHHPDFEFSFQRDGFTETFVVTPKFRRAMNLKLEASSLSGRIRRVTVNGSPANMKWIDSVAGRRVQVTSEAAESWTVKIEWQSIPLAKKYVAERWEPVQAEKGFDWSKKISSSTKLEPVDLTTTFNDKVTQIFRNEYRSPRSPFCSLATPKQGIGGWCEPNMKFEVDDAGLRKAAAANGGKLFLPNGVAMQTPGDANAKNIAFVSQWNNYPQEMAIPLSGKASHAFLLMAGSTSGMQSRFDNGEVIATYADGTTARLALNNPVNWWPIEQDYFIDDYAFARTEPLPPRIDLATGKVRILDLVKFKGQGAKVTGGAATVLELPLDAKKELKSLTVRALANEVVIGLMSVTLER